MTAEKCKTGTKGLSIDTFSGRVTWDKPIYPEHVTPTSHVFPVRVIDGHGGVGDATHTVTVSPPRCSALAPQCDVRWPIDVSVDSSGVCAICAAIQFKSIYTPHIRIAPSSGSSSILNAPDQYVP